MVIKSANSFRGGSPRRRRLFLLSEIKFKRSSGMVKCSQIVDTDSCKGNISFAGAKKESLQLKRVVANMVVLTVFGRLFAFLFETGFLSGFGGWNGATQQLLAKNSLRGPNVCLI